MRHPPACCCECPLQGLGTTGMPANGSSMAASAWAATSAAVVRGIAGSVEAGPLSPRISPCHTQFCVFTRVLTHFPTAYTEQALTTSSHNWRAWLLETLKLVMSSTAGKLNGFQTLWGGQDLSKFPALLLPRCATHLGTPSSRIPASTLTQWG